MDGNHHCFTNSDVFYTADSKGPDGGAKGGKTLLEWVSEISRGKGTVETVCEGDTKAAFPLPPPSAKDETYCSAGLKPKKYALR